VPRFKLTRFKLTVAAMVAVALTRHSSFAQSRVGADSTPRFRRLVRDLGYGTVEGLGFAGIDQVRDNPVEWSRGWNGYAKRAASNIGEFYIQESVTEGLAAAMNRPLDYSPCSCRSTGDRLAWALRGALFDQMPRGRHPLALPRIVGAYAGSFAQTRWRPTDGNRATTTFVNGTTSLAIGAAINLYHEFAPWSAGNRCRRSGSARCAPR
jgi:hypothetical protein